MRNHNEVLQDIRSFNVVANVSNLTSIDGIFTHLINQQYFLFSTPITLLPHDGKVNFDTSSEKQPIGFLFKVRDRAIGTEEYDSQWTEECKSAPVSEPERQLQASLSLENLIGLFAPIDDDVTRRNLLMIRNNMFKRFGLLLPLFIMTPAGITRPYSLRLPIPALQHGLLKIPKLFQVPDHQFAITTFLTPSEVARLSSVCKAFHFILRNDACFRENINKFSFLKQQQDLINNCNNQRDKFALAVVMQTFDRLSPKHEHPDRIRRLIEADPTFDIEARLSLFNPVLSVIAGFCFGVVIGILWTTGRLILSPFALIGSLFIILRGFHEQEDDPLMFNPHDSFVLPMERMGNALAGMFGGVILSLVSTIIAATYYSFKYGFSASACVKGTRLVDDLFFENQGLDFSIKRKALNQGSYQFFKSEITRSFDKRTLVDIAADQPVYQDDPSLFTASALG